MTATLAETAAEYARRGIAVLALHPARKEPAGEVCPHGNDDATTDTDQVRAWWEHNPDYNIGIRPPPGYIVLDVDPRNGGGLDQLGAVPPTSIAKTGGGGWHLWFHYRGAVRGNLDGDRSSGVDIKSNSGYLVAPPSIHDVTGNRYRWISTGPIAPLPKLAIPGLSSIPVLGPVLFHQDALVYLSVALTVGVAWFLKRTRGGMILRACGGSDVSAHSIGYDVIRIRYLAVLFGGLCAGLGGAFLSLAYTPMWVENMTAGRGWIALALNSK